MKKTLKKYFIPHRENEHRPHILRERAVFIIISIVLVLFLASLIGNYAVRNIKSLATIQSAFLVDLTNADRAELGLNQLVINDKLVMAANLKAVDMSEKGYFAHISPDGKTPWYWIQQAGYDYLHAGENLAVNFSKSEDVERAWMNSPTHKANILNNKYTEIGIATSFGEYKGRQTTFVVQMFGNPKRSIISNRDNPLAPRVVEASELNTARVVAVNNTEEQPKEAIVIAQDPATIEDGNFMAFTNPLATEEELVLAEEINNNDEHVVYTNWFQRILVSPSVVVKNIYFLLIILIIFSLILKIFIEIRLQHPKNIAYGVILLLIILVFMYLNNLLTPKLLLL